MRRRVASIVLYLYRRHEQPSLRFREKFLNRSRALLSLLRIMHCRTRSDDRRAKTAKERERARKRENENEVHRGRTRARDNLSSARHGSNIELRSAMRVSHPPRSLARPLFDGSGNLEPSSNSGKIPGAPDAAPRLANRERSVRPSAR